MGDPWRKGWNLNEIGCLCQLFYFQNERKNMEELFIVLCFQDVVLVIIFTGKSLCKKSLWHKLLQISREKL